MLQLQEFTCVGASSRGRGSVTRYLNAPQWQLPVYVVGLVGVASGNLGPLDGCGSDGEDIVSRVENGGLCAEPRLRIPSVRCGDREWIFSAKER
jgi:hypothetical protein